MRRREDVTLRGVNVETVVSVLQDAPVAVALLYGSYARGEQNPESDLDLAVKFDESLTSAERTKARLELIERLSTTLDIDTVDVVPLSHASTGLRAAVLTDGILLVGSMSDVDTAEKSSSTDHSERMAAFDDLLSELKRVV
jgi:predicted nucleotidyltransferase